MFGGYTFGSVTFAGVLALAVIPPAPSGPKKGWPFGADLSVPSAVTVPYFPSLAREIEREDEEMVAIASLFLNLK
jgi:hypothetical protein